MNKGDIKNRYNNSVKSTFNHFTQMTQYIVAYLNTDMEDTTVKIDLGYRMMQGHDLIISVVKIDLMN